MTENLLNGEEFEEDLVDGVDIEADDDLGEEEEVFASNCDGDSGDNFAGLLSTLELIMMDEEFNMKISAFMTEYCDEFEETEENKLIYTKLFEDYVGMLETYIETRMSEEVPGFDMASFCTTLLERKAALEIDLDTLGAFGDFEAFKAMMISCKKGKSCDLQGEGPLCVVGGKVQVHTDEQEDGEEMPDLNLTISGVGA